MKTFFVKYLPVQDEVIIDNLEKNQLLVGFHHRDKYDERFYFSRKASEASVYSDRGFEFTPKQILKLFLCSKDLNIGDEFYNNLGVKTDHLFDQEDIEGHFKVIGEISPDAIWLKEGDELNEDDWTIFWTYFDEEGGLYECNPKILSYEEKEFKLQYGYKPDYIIRVKCDKCNTFH